MTRRLILWLTGVTTAFWLIAAGLGVAVMKDEFDEFFNGSLQETAERLMPLVLDDLQRREGPPSPLHFESQTDDMGEEYLVYQVRDAAGKILIRSHDAPMEPFETPLKRGFWANETYQFYTASAGDGTVFIQVADAMENRTEAIVEGSLALFLPVLVLIPVSVLLIWLIVRRTLAPVDDLREAIEEKDGGNMAPVPSGMLPRELRPIARSVNHLLARLQSAFDAEREFTANSAHELRTPIAGALAQTQMLIAELDGPKKRRAQQIETALANLGHTVEKLLQLARAEAGIGTGAGAAKVDLARVLELVVTDFQRSDPASSARLRLHRQAGAKLEGSYSEDAFAIVLRNLIENALLHGRPEEPIDIRLEKGGVLRIVNGAAPLSPDELATIRKRFGRGATVSPGSGLGLSIAERLLQQMNAGFEVLSPAQGRADGFEVVLRFGRGEAAG
ncbi:histidine kinase [Pararhizobium polonicum]|uniref:histidine kinase n=1 Tax=Pararhizobium polonicum TaxID=1612624 RepID=A0A1C7NST1_9HYPH|nr:histidine kinase dimerization/phospho-acceptor domain-containing protein [Pararhizobium polonicum]OBZ92037.1 histidine kinase [Pararhizobium polonicum]